MNTHHTTAQAFRRSFSFKVSACAALVTALVGLAQPQFAAAQTEISASIAPAQRYRAPDNGSAAVTIAVSDRAADGQQAPAAGVADLQDANVKAADRRAFALQAAERRAYALQAAERRAYALQAAERRAYALQAAERRAYALQAAERRAYALQAADRRAYH